MEEAHELQHNWIGTEHLLLGLLRERDGVAGEVLQALGLDLDRARAEVLKVLGHEPHFRPRPRPRERDRRPQVIELHDAADTLRARLAFTEDQQPFLGLFDSEGRERLTLKLEADGSPRLEMRDGRGTVIFRAP